jgi:hypothetical protein
MGQPKLSITLHKDERLGAMALREAYHSKLSRILLVTRGGDSLVWLPELQYIASGDSGIKKPPILWARSMFPVLFQLQGDEGARSILASPDYRGLIVEEALAYRFQDADTIEDIANIKETLSNLRK